MIHNLHNLRFTGFALLLISCAFLCGCTKRGRDATDSIVTRLSDQKTKTDNLRNAMRYLKQLTPVNREQTIKEVQVELNTWMQEVDPSRVEYSIPDLWPSLPQDMLQELESAQPASLQFGYWDIDYLFECRLMRLMSDWITGFPIRDDLVADVLAKHAAELSKQDAVRLEEAYKLFDWTIRNVALSEDGASVEQKFQNPRPPINDFGFGYSYLPWETILFSRGDYVERGRAFAALARQRGIDTVWIEVDAQDNSRGTLWTMGVLIGEQLFLFDPKLGFPILDPDAVKLATLAEAKDNNRVLRRLDLPGQFDYAYDPGSLQDLRLLIDAVPASISARMKVVESGLLSDERMRLFLDTDKIQQRLQAIVPEAKFSIWQTPLMAQVHAASVRDRLDSPSDFTMKYMSRHAVWLLDTPASKARLQHIRGNFENTLDEDGALSMYMDCRVPDELIEKLAYNPDVQRELGITRLPGEPQEAFEFRIMQSQAVYGRAKVDVAFLMAQLHFDRGNYDDAEKWLKKRVLDDERAAQWHAPAWYLLGRIYQELDDPEGYEAAFTHEPTPQEAGNRLRLRYLRSLDDA